MTRSGRPCGCPAHRLSAEWWRICTILVAVASAMLVLPGPRPRRERSRWAVKRPERYPRITPLRLLSDIDQALGVESTRSGNGPTVALLRRLRDSLRDHVQHAITKRWRSR